MAVSVYYPEISRKIFSIPENKRIVIGTALGWPDPDEPVNKFDRQRGKLDEFITFKS